MCRGREVRAEDGAGDGGERRVDDGGGCFNASSRYQVLVATYEAPTLGGRSTRGTALPASLHNGDPSLTDGTYRPHAVGCQTPSPCRSPWQGTIITGPLRESDIAVNTLTPLHPLQMQAALVMVQHANANRQLWFELFWLGQHRSTIPGSTATNRASRPLTKVARTSQQKQTLR